MSQLRIFLCHASEDKPQVRQLAERLRGDGFETWLDHEQLLPGQDWDFEISAALRRSDVVVVCLSSVSVLKAGYVQKELRKVLDTAERQPEGKIFVIPVRLEDCPVPRSLGNWHRADLFTPGGYERLRLALQVRSGDGLSPPVEANRDPRPDPRLDPQPRPYPRKEQWPKWSIWAGGALAGVAILALFSLPAFRGNRTASVTSPPKSPNLDVPGGMARIPGGLFLMGRNGSSDPEAAPAHEVSVAAFYLDRTPVTDKQFGAYLRKTGRHPQEQKTRGEAPATEMTWDEAFAYCLDQGKRLPTESEWEYAARGTDGRLYPWGESFDPSAVNFRSTGLGRPEPAGIHSRNISPFGIADMSGNVWQWCADDYRPYSGRKPAFSIPAGAKVIRGGSYASREDQVTAVARNLELPSKRSPEIGFRCAK